MRQLRAAIIVELVGRQADDLLAAILHRALGPAVRGEKAHHRHHGLALAGSGFADDGDGLAGGDVEVDALHRVEDAVAGAEADVEIADREDGLGHAQRSFGSSASRRPSPMKLRQNRVVTRVSEG